MGRFLVKLLWLASIIAFVPQLYAADPWDAAFTDNTAAILEAAGKIQNKGDAEIIVLLEQHRYVINNDGRIASTLRKVFWMQREDAIEDWSSVEQEYEPWHENRPQLRARVISSEGKVHWLDPKTIDDSPAQEFDASIFSDRRVVRAPLPAIAAGSIIEYQIQQRENEPLFDAGVTRRITVQDYVPIIRFRIEMESDKSVNLRTASKLIPESSIRRYDTAGKIRIECDLGPLEARDSFESGLPSDVPNYPYISFSTGRSWQEVASRYHGIVDRQIGSSDLSQIIRGIDLKGTSRAVAARIVARLHKDIRYTGVEFGEAAIVPRTPEEILGRKYGDCKDKAAILVALLRSAGMRAHMALLSAGTGSDIDPDLPGFGVFDHAIVYIEDEKPFWIDATAENTRVGELPFEDQGRLALIAADNTQSVVRTPESQSTDNWQKYTIDARMSDFGAGEIQETLQAGGTNETALRGMFGGGSEKELKESLLKYIQTTHLANSLGQYAVTKKEEFGEAFKITLRSSGAKRLVTEQDTAFAAIFPNAVFEDLPYILKPVRADNPEKPKPRTQDFVFAEPYSEEYHYKIYPPAGFKVQNLPASVETQIGSATYSASYRENDSGMVEATFRFDTGKRRLSPSEFEAMRDGLQQYSSQTPEVITFVSKASEFVALGKIREALNLMNGLTAKNPDQPGIRVRLSRLLVTLGAVDRAISEAKRAVEMRGQFGPAWQALGWAYQHDSFGRRFRQGWKPDEAERCYREAIRLYPDDATARMDLAVMLEHNEQGERYGKGSRLKEAIELYREILKTTPDPAVKANLVIALLYAGRYPQVKSELSAEPRLQGSPAVSIAVTALTASSAQAIIEARSALPDENARAMALGSAGIMLMQLRQYGGALELMRSANKILNTVELNRPVAALDKIRPYEQILFQAGDPRFPVQQLILQALAGRLEPAQVRPFFSKRVNWAGTESKLPVLRRMAKAYGYMQRLGPVEFKHEVELDLILNSLKLEKKGEDGFGYQVSDAEEFSMIPLFHVILEDGQYRIIGWSGSLGAIGELVLELLERQDIKSAQRWLDEVVRDRKILRSTNRTAVRLLWSGVVEATRGPDSITAAAASLIGQDYVSEKSIHMLRERSGKTKDKMERAQIDLALCESLENARKWEDLLIVLRDLSHQIYEDDNFYFTTEALSRLKRWNELSIEAEKRLKKKPDDSRALRMMATALVNKGNHDEASTYLRKMIGKFLDFSEISYAAWGLMLTGKGDEQTLAEISRIGISNSPNYFCAIGALKALLGRPEEAQGSLNSALDQSDALDAKMWALRGRILESYGLADEAKAAFEKMNALKSDDEETAWAITVLTSRNK